jgi:hypothetical protein
MSEFVRCPKAKRDTWWHKPWAEVIAAARAGEDGLSVEAPRITPQWEHPPRRERYQGENADALYAKDRAAYEHGVDMCYFREGEGHYHRGITNLFQQNW